MRIYLFVHVIIVLLVILTFRIVPDRKIASLLASSLFLGGSFWVIWSEVRIRFFWKRFSFYGAVIFLLVSALPIVSLRLLHWDQNFSDIHFLGFSGNDLHQFSNKVFVAMLIGFFIDLQLSKKQNPDQDPHL